MSSTYLDLIDEREHVLRVLLELGCFPAGMELFPAEDSTAWDHIKREIDESDIYLLIVSGRYGSVDESGMSYTEKEYRYAVERGKTVLAFIHSAPGSLSATRVELEVEPREKLKAFLQDVRKAHLIQSWKSGEELGRRVATTLNRALSGRVGGWVRDEERVAFPGAPQVEITDCREVTTLTPDGFTVDFTGNLRAVGGGTEVFARKSGADAGSEFVELKCTTPGMTTLAPSVSAGGWSSTFIHLGRWLAPGEQVPISWTEVYRQVGDWQPKESFSLFVRYSIGSLHKVVAYPDNMRPQRASTQVLLGDIGFGAVLESIPAETTGNAVELRIMNPKVGHTYTINLEWDTKNLRRVNKLREKLLPGSDETTPAAG